MADRKIGLHVREMTLRGAEVALFDYAYFGREILGFQPIIFYDGQLKSNRPSVIEKFKKHFELVPYQEFNELNKIAERKAVEAIYIIKSGERDFQTVESTPNLIHAVFPQKVSERHGEVYAFVSEWLSKECSNGKIPFVPHMIFLPDLHEDLRVQLNIPKHATVFGCYGGSDSFNIQFVQQSIQKSVLQRSDVYFVFMNISPFAQHERILFIPGNLDMNNKVRFINTCDAMIHARGIGESFGLACGEFSIRNKPVITYALSPQRSHIEILGQKALKYRGPREIEQIILNFDKSWSKSQDWNCYSKKFSPEAVMKKFDSVFLQGSSKEPNLNEITIGDKCTIQYYRARKKLRSLSRKLYL
jgi:hypothetical protein